MTGEVVRIQGGDPGHQIVEKTKEMNVDFLVTGSRGLGKLRRTLMGSVSDYLVHHAHIPVMVYKHTDKEHDKHQWTNRGCVCVCASVCMCESECNTSKCV